MKQFACIVCPCSCRVRVEEGKDGLAVSGHRCRRGEEYARREYTNPLRVLTSTVALRGGGRPLLPVRTSAPVPKGKLMECMAEINCLTVEAPVVTGQVVKSNLAGTGADLIATRSVGQ